MTLEIVEIDSNKNKINPFELILLIKVLIKYLVKLMLKKENP